MREETSLPSQGAARRVLRPALPGWERFAFIAIIAIRTLLCGLYHAWAAAAAVLGLALGWVALLQFFFALVVDTEGLLFHRAWRVRWGDIVDARAKRFLSMQHFEIDLRKRKAWRRRFTLWDAPGIRAALVEFAPPEHPLRAAIPDSPTPPAGIRWPFQLLLMMLTALFAVSAFQLEVVWLFLALKEGTPAGSRVRHFEKSRSEFERDLARADGLAVFRPPFGPRDAGTWLNARLAWNTKDWSPTARSNAPKELPPELPAACAKHWLECIDQLAAMDVDLSWMTTLRAFDHWDLDATGPRADAGRRGTLDPMGLPWADLLPVLYAARIRLARGVVRGDLESAVSETRWLARLMYSTETFSGALYSLAMLNDETELRSREGHRLKAPSRAEPLIDPADTKAAWNAILVSASLFNPVMPSTDLDAVFGRHEHFGACVAMSEDMPMLARARPLLEVRFHSILTSRRGTRRSTA